MGPLLITALAFTFLATITDIRRRLIPNWLTYPMIASGVLYHAVVGLLRGDLVQAFAGALGASVAFILGLALYSVGGWAGGDVKLFTGLGAILPETDPPYPIFISVLFNSVLLVAFSLPALAVLRRGRGIFYQTVDASELREGMIPAEPIVCEGRVYASPRRAAGLTRRQVLEIKRLVRDGKIPGKIRVKTGIPFAPVLLAGLVFFIALGDLYWFLLSHFLGIP